MWASPIVIIDLGTDASARLGSRLERVEEDALVFEAAPQPLDQYVVHPAAAPVHGDADASVLQRRREGEASELASLIGVERSRLPSTALRCLSPFLSLTGVALPRQRVGRERVTRHCRGQPHGTSRMSFQKAMPVDFAGFVVAKETAILGADHARAESLTALRLICHDTPWQAH